MVTCARHAREFLWWKPSMTVMYSYQGEQVSTAGVPVTLVMHVNI